MAQNVSTNTFGVAKWVVSADATQGTHTTIGAAITSASSGDTIFIRDGSYTENLTLKAGVNLVGLSGSQNRANVVVTGKMSASFSGVCSISNIDLVTNGDFCLELTGANATAVNCYDCFFSSTNASLINSTGSNAASGVTLFQCAGNLGTTGVKIINSSNGLHSFYNTVIANTGASTTSSTISAGTLGLSGCIISAPFTTSSTGVMVLRYTVIDTSATNTTCVTIGGGTSSSTYCQYNGGTASAVSIGSTFGMVDNTVTSSNTNAVTGAGTLSYSPIIFNGSSSTVNTSTQNPLNIGPKIYASGGISFDSGTTTLSTYTEGTFTPTMVGASTAGTTTYTNQNGYYRRIGNLVTIQFTVVGTAATGTGNITFGGFPFTIKNQTNGSPQGAILGANGAAFVYVTGTTMMTLAGTINTTTAIVWNSGSAVAGGPMQMANTTFNFQGTLTYEI